MTKVWNIGYRFNDKTGTKRPWEVVNQVYENGKRVAIVQWNSCATEKGAIKSIEGSRARSVEPMHAKNYAEAEITLEWIGRIK